jgi:chromosomal replication initiation ATPase DnaA
MMLYLDGRFRFDNYVVGSANRLAVAAARAVAESPGTVYNPLFIYSSSGLGKTHLVGAIGYHARQMQPELVVEYLTVDDFVEQLHVAVSTGQSEPFKQRYKQVDLLLLDDVQFLTGRRETQSELLRLFNALQGSGRQIVMTSDRPPSEIADVDERLITRLVGGLIVDIGTPDFETKVAILRNVCRERELRFGAGVLEELSQLEFASVRELQGALTRLAAHQTLGEGEVMPAHVRRLLGERSPESRFTPVTPPGTDGEFLSFVADVAATVASAVETWKADIVEAMERWQAQGYRVDVLERALELPKAPDVGGLLTTFGQAVEHLRRLEEEASALDPGLAALPLFRDPTHVGAAEQFVQRLRTVGALLQRPSADFPRERYVVSGSNQLAVRAADAVVESPGAKYNPLFLHGPSGVGKTHLVHAIGLALQQQGTGGRLVACVSAPAFVDELIVALQQGGVEQWRSRYRAVDALLIDDVHFVAGKERTQEELFHIFNTLAASGRQIVLASDRPPRELEELAERLRTRFEGGLVAEVEPPDRALREELFRRLLANHIAAVPDDLVSYLADRPLRSVRELQGTMNRLQAASEVAGVPVSLQLARATLEEAPAPSAAAPAHLEATADAYFLDGEKIVWEWPDAAGRLIEELR